MKPELLLNLRRLPSRLNAEQTAILIGCKDHDIPILIKAGLLKPLGKPVSNAVKYFSSSDLEEKIADVKWNAKVTEKLYEYWRESKGRRDV
ncbi:MAG: hypothetical protein P1V20_21690 [Verrucomicrobiales bacterium]|nr:hypothetical protein [Verrucomicrobiales bacterium]